MLLRFYSLGPYMQSPFNLLLLTPHGYWIPISKISSVHGFQAPIRFLQSLPVDACSQFLKPTLVASYRNQQSVNFPAIQVTELATERNAISPPQPQKPIRLNTASPLDTAQHRGPAEEERLIPLSVR